MSWHFTSPLPPSVLKNLGERLYLPSNLFAAEEDPPPQVLVKAIILKPKKDVCGGRLLDTLRQSPLQHIATTMERPFCDGISSDM